MTVFMDAILGTAQLSVPYGVLSDSVQARGQDPFDLIRAAVEAGFVALDTAPAYGSAETLIGASGIDCPVHTKLDPTMEPAESLAASLDRLRRDAVDVVYLHDPEAAIRDGGSAVTRTRQLIGSGAYRLGVSVYSEDALLAGIANPHVDVIQLPVNPINTHLYRLALEAQNREVTILGRSTLAQGLLTADPRSVPAHLPSLRLAIEGFQELSLEFGVSALQIAVGWSRSLIGLRGIVVGLTSTSQVAEYMDALLSPPLDQNVLERLTHLPDVPLEELDARNWTRS